VTTNTVEGVFSLLECGIYGTFHGVSREHLHQIPCGSISDTRRLRSTIARAQGAE
jgi:hypothetical protein